MIFQRKLRTFEKRNDSMQKSMDTEAVEEAIDFTLQTTETVKQDITEVQTVTTATPEAFENVDKMFVSDNGFLKLHKDHSDYLNLIRLQFENQELINWKNQLQARINSERAECVILKRLVSKNVPDPQPILNSDDPELEKLVEHFLKENALLEQKRVLLAKEVLEENISLIQLQVDVAMKQLNDQ